MRVQPAIVPFIRRDLETEEVIQRDESKTSGAAPTPVRAASKPVSTVRAMADVEAPRVSEAKLEPRPGVVSAAYFTAVASFVLAILAIVAFASGWGAIAGGVLLGHAFGGGLATGTLAALARPRA